MTGLPKLGLIDDWLMNRDLRGGPSPAFTTHFSIRFLSFHIFKSEEDGELFEVLWLLY